MPSSRKHLPKATPIRKRATTAEPVQRRRERNWMQDSIQHRRDAMPAPRHAEWPWVLLAAEYQLPSLACGDCGAPHRAREFVGTHLSAACGNRTLPQFPHLDGPTILPNRAAGRVRERRNGECRPSDSHVGTH
jgi:hypothetical protein